MTKINVVRSSPPAAAFALAPAIVPRAEQVRPGRHRQGDQARPHQSLCGPALGLWRDRQGHHRLLEHGQRPGRHQRPQDQLHHLRRRLPAAQDGRDGAQARRGRSGLRDLPAARHADQHGGAEVPQPEEGAAALRRDRRVQVGRSQGIPVDHGLAARLRHRGRDLRQAHHGQPSRRQGRRCSTRTTISGKDYLNGFMRASARTRTSS